MNRSLTKAGLLAALIGLCSVAGGIAEENKASKAGAETEAGSTYRPFDSLEAYKSYLDGQNIGCGPIDDMGVSCGLVTRFGVLGNYLTVKASDDGEPMVFVMSNLNRQNEAFSDVVQALSVVMDTLSLSQGFQDFCLRDETELRRPVSLKEELGAYAAFCTVTERGSFQGRGIRLVVKRPN